MLKTMGLTPVSRTAFASWRTLRDPAGLSVMIPRSMRVESSRALQRKTSDLGVLDKAFLDDDGLGLS
jgi:hypothetical protein